MRWFVLFFLWIFLLSCSKENVGIQDNFERGDLITLSEAQFLTREQSVERITEFDASVSAKYGVRYHVVKYRTEYQGKPIDSEGLLLIPEAVNEIRLLVYLHGTEIPSKMLGADKITPSHFDGGIEDYRDVRNMGLGWASAGYTVFIPDYIGFGITLGKDHPYLVYSEMFVSNIDGLLAVKDALKQKSFSFNNKLFITGWSQGAGAALSMNKFIQESYAKEFEITGTSGLSGPYNFYRFAESFLEKTNENIKALPIFSWGLYSLNKFTSLRRPYDQMYSYPVFDQFSSILGPSNKPSEIFNAYFLKIWQEGKDEKLKKVLEENSFHEGWKPKGKLFLHHGDADNLVPLFNTQDAFHGLKAAGGDVSVYIYPGGGHDTELGNFIENTLSDFNKL